MEKLVKIQAELKAPKNMYNSFGKYHYRNAESICEAVKPLLLKNKCYLTISDSIEMVGERIYVKATALLMDCEDGNIIAQTCAYAREPEEKKGMDSSQVTGTASSYARKYALNGLFLLDDTKDADEYVKQTTQEAPKEETAEVIAKEKVSDIKVKSLMKRCKEDNVDVNTILKLYKVKTLNDLTEKQYLNIHEHWDKIKEQ